MATDFFKLFTNLGLSKVETKIYLSGLELGPTSVQEIAKKAKVSRTAAYEVIESLQKRGLISSFTRNKKRFFVSEDPERAARHFREQIELMTKQIGDLDKAIPEMKLMGGGERPVVRFYEGREAVYSLFNDLAEVKPKSFDEVSNMDDLYDFMDLDYLRAVREVLDPTKIPTRILHRGKLRQPGRSNVQFCELLPDLGNFHGDIWIYGNRVAFASFVGKVMAVIIESEAFAETAHVLFEAAWRICIRANQSETKK